ncbi:GTP-binding protein HflX [Melghiribacillus thermohalophilus]|uniref:GTPase HflX n=1 Tax=Melghiribacillus thermohalophilus TaxID=1324956 RepID=A0A4V2V2V2_9BACI|nr:GTPase HflX [Melghiribacillus thermohalophilus]TCT26681.1 GTP-binding protein HflX [Melghiribacillus thermohalophilus]
MEQKERVLLAACYLNGDDEERFESSLKELQSLTETAKGKVVEIVTQKRLAVHPSTYIGGGKLQEIKQLADDRDIDLVIFNDELSPAQLRNISRTVDVRVIDRTQLILDIFAARAKTKEGKLQVELAQLQYLLPRLYGKGVELSRLGGGIGTRGPGETKLETDRRHIHRRMTEIKRQLRTVVNNRKQYRLRRQENHAFQIAIVGYTNAGKSTLFNQLTERFSLEEDQLFATLDPMTGKIRLPGGFQAIISDTVGFIQDLPTTLIAAFRSTLEEISDADLILHVVDASAKDYPEHEHTVYGLLKELDADHISTLTVYNKKEFISRPYTPVSHPFIKISALDKEDVEELKHTIEKILKKQWVFYEKNIPIKNGKLVHQLKEHTIVESRDIIEDQELYRVSGYVNPEHPIYQQLKE